MILALLAVLTVIGLLDWAILAGSRWFRGMEWMEYGGEEENKAGAGGDSGENVEGREDTQGNI